MKIQKVSVELCNLGTIRPYAIAYKTVDKVENVVVRLELENGIVGYGAANPSSWVVGESVEDCYRTLSQKADDLLRGRDIRLFGNVLNILERNFGSTPGSRAALDIALHDAFAKLLGVPLAGLLGQTIFQMPTSITIGIKSVDETLQDAEEFYAMGFRYLKVKLGQVIEEDIEKLFKLRERFGQNVHIRVDANPGYSREAFLQFYHKVQSLNLELIEQPLKAEDIEGMAGLPLPMRQSIAADESLITYADALQLASKNACGIFNIKLMKTGGIAQAQQIANIAQWHGIQLMWGCNDESVISIAAALHLAFSFKNTKFLDLDGSLDLAIDVAKGGFLLENGIMSLAPGTGLGLQPL